MFNVAMRLYSQILKLKQIWNLHSLFSVSFIIIRIYI